MRKRIMALVSALALLAALAACGRRESAAPDETQAAQPATTAAREAEGDIASPQEQPQTQPQTTAAQEVGTQPSFTPDEAEELNTNTGPLFQKYVREKVADGTYTLRTEQSGMKIIITADGGNSVIESDAAGLLRFSLVHKDNSYYMVMHTSKKYTQMSEEAYKKQVSSVGSAGVDLDGMLFRESGTESVNGKRYSTETYDEGEQGIVTYFFDETGVQRTRIVKNGKTSETDVFAVSDGADASAFEIPADYTAVSDPAQLMS